MDSGVCLGRGFFRLRKKLKRNKKKKKGKQNECWAEDISAGAGSKPGIKSPLRWGLKRKAALQGDQKKHPWQSSVWAIQS